MRAKSISIDLRPISAKSCLTKVTAGRKSSAPGISSKPTSATFSSNFSARSAFIATQVDIIKSDRVALRVVRNLKLAESPAFARMKAEGKASKAPLTESFARWDNLKVVIMSLLGGTAGQAVVWYTGQFYALFFLLQTLKIEPQTANLLIAGSLLIGTPFFVIFGSLSDRIGRKGIIMAGCLIAALTYFPLFKALTHYANPAIEEASISAPAKVIADPATCSFQFDPIGKKVFNSSCDIATSALAKAGVPYTVESRVKVEDSA